MSIELIAPTPLPGECVYGIASAFAHRWFRDQRQGMVLLFGGAAPCTRDVPARLSQLARSLPASLKLDAEQLALRHTALPLHLPFFEPAHGARVLKLVAMGKAMQLTLGLAPSRLICARALRVCPRCLEKDLADYGRGYWHREHQLAGGLCCPWHGIPLHGTNVRPEAMVGRPAIASPIQATMCRSECPSGNDRSLACRISRELASLLDPKLARPGPTRLHQYYRQRLIEAGYCQLNHSISLRRLRADITAFYGPRLLRRIACSVPLHYGWLAALVRRPRSHVQPLHHLLLMVFLRTEVAVALKAAVKTVPQPLPRLDHPHRIKNPCRLRALRPTKRQAWLQALDASPGCSARVSHSALYGWLWRNDRDWLHQHRQPTPPRVANADVWAKRDARLSDIIRRVAMRIRMTSPSQRASRSVIASRCRCSSWLVRDHPRLPKAAAAIKAATESAAAFAVRRLRKLADARGRRVVPSWKLRVQAGISVSVANHPLVARTLRALSARLAHEPR